MTAIAGAVCLDGRPAETALVARMLDRLAHRGRAVAIVSDGAAALGARDAQAVREPAAGLCIALHGRVAGDGGLSSEQRVARAYESRAGRFPEGLAGEFSTALWDASLRRLFLVRDRLGVRPLYYAVADRTLLFASELQALFAHPSLSRDPNPGFIGEILCDVVHSREETLFAAIRRVAPAHVLVAVDGRVETRRYWSLAVAARETAVAGGDTAARCRELIENAIRRHSVGEGIVGVQLSGGVDSSAVLGVAAAMGVPLRAYNVAHAAPACDERHFARAACTRAACELRAIAPSPWDPTAFVADAARSLDLPAGPNGGPADRGMYSAAAADGVRVLLSGEGGDEWFTGSLQRHADLLATRRWAELAAHLRAAPTLSAAFQRLAFAGVWPLLPAGLRAAARAVAGRRAGGTRLAPWLAERFVDAASIEERRARPEYDRRAGLSRASWQVAQFAEDGWQAFAFELSDRILARVGLEERHPFYDVDLVTFAVALPEAERSGLGEPKRILRRAVGEVVPPEILARRDKAEYSHLYVQALQAHGGERAFDRLALAAEGWVRPEPLRAAYRAGLKAHVNGAVTGDLPAVWTVLAVDCWFKQAVLGSQPVTAGIA